MVDAAWHLPLCIGGVAGWLFSIVTGSILMTWLFNSRRGSVLAVALFGLAIPAVFGGTNLSRSLRVQDPAA
jgi:hypothetical protein